jgi:hypothetical protein
MQPLIYLIVYVVLFCVAVYGAKLLLSAFKMPDPAYWITGAIFLIILLLFVANQMGVGGTYPPLFHR